MKVIKIIYVFPIILILAIWMTIQYIKSEYYNDDIIEHEINKVYKGEDYFIDSMVDKLKPLITNNKYHIHLFSAIAWLIIILKVIL